MQTKHMNTTRSAASLAYARSVAARLASLERTVAGKVDVYRRNGVPVPADLLQQYITRAS